MQISLVQGSVCKISAAQVGFLR